MTTIAVLGTGIMGAPIARNLCGARFDVRVWNRTRDKAEPLADAGATVAADPAAAAAGADILLTMLIDADAVADTVGGADGALAALARGGVGTPLWLQMSTVGIAGTDRLRALAADHGVTYVDAPVLGTKQPAEQGALTVLAAGDESVRNRCEPVFDAIGQKTVWVGAEPGRATRLKLALNSWVLALTTATAEALALADGLGVEPQQVLDTIKGGPLDADYAQLKGGAMLSGEFPPAFPVGGAVKDAGLILEAAEEAGVQMLVADAVRRQMSTAAESGHRDEDMGAVWHAVRD